MKTQKENPKTPWNNPKDPYWNKPQHTPTGNNMNPMTRRAPMENGTVILKRTFNQKMYDQDLRVVGIIKFWRIVGPVSHPNYHSDLSLEGLKDWGII